MQICLAGEKKNSLVHKLSDMQIGKQASMNGDSTSIQQQVSNELNQSFSQSSSLDGVSSLLSILPSGTDSSFDATLNDELQQPKKKKRKRGLRE